MEIKEVIMGKGIRIVKKPDYIQYEHLQECLDKAHEVNLKKGLVYATNGQTIDTLIEKLKDSVTYVALTPDNMVVATASVQFRKISHWYHNGEIGLIKLVGVLPEYSGLGIARILLVLLITEVKFRKIEVCVSDSAEANVAMRHLFIHNGFKIVDCCKYNTNNFVSVVYGYWFHGCPYSGFKRWWKYNIHRRKL